jgi:hypothetical protein
MRNYRARAIKDGQPVFDEYHEHCIVAAWLDANKVFYCHPANGEWRHPATARRLKRMGVKAGCPDFLIFKPPPNAPDKVGTAIELKALDGTLSETQRQFLATLNIYRWSFAVCFGARQAIEYLERQGYGQGKTALK